MFSTQIDNVDPKTCAIFIQAWGSSWGSSGFVRNQIDRGSSGTYATCIYCGLIVKINTLKSRTAREDRGHICFKFVFACVVGKDPKTPKLNPMADDAIYMG